jgi:hypothetical protein
LIFFKSMSETKDIKVAIDGDIEIVNFNKKSIRRIKFGGEWWYSVIDIVNSLLDKKEVSQDKGAYWRKLKERLKNEGGNEVVTKCHGLKLEAKDLLGNYMLYLHILLGLSFITYICSFILSFKRKERDLFLRISFASLIGFLVVMSIVLFVCMANYVPAHTKQCEELALNGHSVSSCISCQKEISDIIQRISHCERMYKAI